MVNSYFSGEMAPLGDRKPYLTIDIECEKIKGNFRWASGEMQKTRWKTFMVGIGFCTDNRSEVLIFWSDNERELLDDVSDSLGIYSGNVQDIIYQNTKNRFDEMVLKGRFINARRALAILPGEWAGEELEEYEFRRVPVKENLSRINETLRWNEYASSLRKGNMEIVAHCARDCYENLLKLSGATVWNEKFWENPLLVGEID